MGSIERGKAQLEGMQVTEAILSVAKTADVTLEVYEQVIYCNNTVASFTITLPSISEAAGKLYSIKLITDSGVNTVTVEDQSDSYDFAEGGAFILTAATDFVLLYSDGFKWYTLSIQET